MIKTSTGYFLLASLAVCSMTLSNVAQAAGPDSVVSDRVKQLTRAMPWRPVASIPINFNTHHPQGMVKIGDDYFVSSVEIRTATKRFAQPQGGYDRDTGEGVAQMTYNPMWIESTTTGVRAYFMPEDEKSTLYVYEVDVK